MQDAAGEAARNFPEIIEVRLFGSMARGEETGLSDVDIFIAVKSGDSNPIQRMKPYFRFFSERLDMSIDMIVALEGEIGDFRDVLGGTQLLYTRRETPGAATP
ncbi:MAG TPA: nucleotidyltransferase domain-containing protein [Thermodesulfobacteriota bacterium]|nr:nucleotidyltransferase domain-containing protein [Thermodesulfobacteriota bacterium]